jgi:hypothetical protein
MGLLAGVLVLHSGKMPEAFDGGGLCDAAAATPAASRFGMQMSPHNAAARQVSPVHCMHDFDRANKPQLPLLSDQTDLLSHPSVQEHNLLPAPVQEAASPNLRAGLTPHIKALRSSLACDGGDGPAAAPASLPRAVPPSGQPGGRRVSLAEAPRANLLFEPAAEGEVGKAL